CCIRHTATRARCAPSLHDALPIFPAWWSRARLPARPAPRRPWVPVRQAPSVGCSRPSRHHRTPRGSHSPLMMTRALLTAVLLLRSEEHTSELQSCENLVCRLLLEK